MSPEIITSIVFGVHHAHHEHHWTIIDAKVICPDTQLLSRSGLPLLSGTLTKTLAHLYNRNIVEKLRPGTIEQLRRRRQEPSHHSCMVQPPRDRAF
jgi:hypothetical protein